MSRLAPKIALSLAVAVAAAAVLWFAFPRQPQQDMAFHPTELPAALPPAELAAGAAADLATLPSPLEVEQPIFPPSSFRRWPLQEPAVRRLFDVDELFFEYDPWCYFRRQAFLNLRRPWEEHPKGFFVMRTNSLGLRMDGEPSARRPDLRILVAGDSHVDGVCFNLEGFPALLEAGLAAERPGQTVEVLNGACGGYTFHNYLGLLERFLSLAPDQLVVTVYGGNDFYEVLPIHHRFAGTGMPSGGESYPVQLSRAADASTAALSQVFLSYKYFAAFPEQVEEALQAARDVTTEIHVTCLRHGIRPVFVYLPPAARVEWDVHAEPLEAVLSALELEREQLGTLDRMADSYLAFLRERRLDAIDLRPVFAAEEQPLFWERDHHLNLRGQELVAGELLSLLGDLRPPAAQRVRPSRSALEPRSYELGATLQSPGAPGTVSPGESSVPTPAPAPPAQIETVDGELVTLPPFEQRPLAAGAAGELFPLGEDRRYDPVTYVELRPGLHVERPWREHPNKAYLLRTNALGLRSDSEVLSEHPDLRVLIAGDGQVDGAFDNEHSLGGQLIQILAERHPDVLAEALTAACQGHSFHNYLGVFRKHEHLRPDLFVVVVNGADDFMDVVRVEARLEGSAPRPSDFDARLERAGLPPSPGLRAALEQALYFQGVPDQAALALRLAQAATLALQRACEEAGARLLVVYVPPAIQTEREELEARLRPQLKQLEITPQLLNRVGALGEVYCTELRRAGVSVFDLTPQQRARERRSYWFEDQHLNLRGQNDAAAVVAEVAERWFALDGE